MAKNLKLNIKNTQIAEAVNLSGLKGKLAAKKKVEEEVTDKKSSPKTVSKGSKNEKEELPKEEAPRIKARSKSAFAEPHLDNPKEESESIESEETVSSEPESPVFSLKSEDEPTRPKTSAEIRKEIFGDTEEEEKDKGVAPKATLSKAALTDTPSPVIPIIEEKPTVLQEEKPKPQAASPAESTSTPEKKKQPEQPPASIQTGIPRKEESRQLHAPQRPKEFHKPPTPAPKEYQPHAHTQSTKEQSTYEKLGPTGRHVKDFLKPKPAPQRPAHAPHGRQEGGHHAASKPAAPIGPPKALDEGNRDRQKHVKPREDIKNVDEDAFKKGPKAAKFKEFRDVKPPKKGESRQFDARDRQGLRVSDEEEWRKRRPKQGRVMPQQEETIRPTSLSIRTPISIKDLAVEMKLKASQLVGKLFLQGLIVTLNDLLEDETTIQLLGHEFGCEITIDKTEEKRIRVTEQTIKEELQTIDPTKLTIRPPVVAFMGHVDHGKTSLIDAIRKSNRAAGEAGAITQHIGAFRCSTPVGDITFLDTPGHEAFSAMRARGADVTDIVVLVVAGDEGLRQQSIEAIQHAKAAKVIIVVAINKSDKPNFNPDNVYRQLAEQDLLPESWGGQTITVNCSAVTGEGIPNLLEMLALQAEVLELRANPETRARGTVLESELHKGHGNVATVLVQNGTLKRGDAVVFAQHWGRIKTMRDEYGRELQEAGPSCPVEITGLSGLPNAGQDFIVVKNEKEAREISEARSEGFRQSNLSLQQKKKTSMENLFQQASETSKKILNIVLRADVQGSLEALKVALLKIQSDKADLNIIFAGVGEVSESDVQLAAASRAVIIGFHTQIESHAESLLKQLGIQVRLHDIIYHAIDDAKDLMSGLLDKIAQETDKGKAIVKATFKSSHAGVIAGCQVIEGSIARNNHIRLKRGQEVIWKGTIASLKRVKEDVREVQKGMECGILLNNFSDIHEDDILEAYEITYISQSL